MPVTLASHRGIIRASIVQGSAPLLISRSALKKLGAQLDFKKDTLSILGGAPINLRTNSAGQYIVDVMGSQGSAVASLVQKEVMFASTEQGPATVLDCVEPQTVPVDPEPGHPCVQQPDPVGSEAPVESTSFDASPTSASLSLWTQEDCHVSQIPNGLKLGTGLCVIPHPRKFSVVEESFQGLHNIRPWRRFQNIQAMLFLSFALCQLMHPSRNPRPIIHGL